MCHQPLLTRLPLLSLPSVSNVSSLPSTPTTTLHTAHCALHTKHCTHNTAHCTLHTAHKTQHTKHKTQHTAHKTLHTKHCTLHTKHCRPPAHCIRVLARKINTSYTHTSHIRAYSSYGRHAKNAGKNLNLTFRGPTVHFFWGVQVGPVQFDPI